MATKDNTPGLLSKVAKFVRNPTTNWTDLDKPDEEPDTGYSKQALKEMIERKRQNDFVRRREFDQLRKLRSRGPGGANADLAGRPSYFQSSLPSNPGERAMTIKKIDEIEAQMSNQWWQGKNDGAKAPAGAAAAGRTAAAPPKGAPGSPQDRAYAPTKLSPLGAESVSPPQPDFLPTQTNSSFGQDAAAPSPQRKAVMHDPPRAARRVESQGFMHSQPFAVELVDGVTDPDLEEAAIRFANGDNAGAENGLLTALEGPDVRRDLAESWTAALFDLYRATGQQDRFDTVAIDFAERYGRSAPAWFSMPDNLGLKLDTALQRTLPSRLMDDPIWHSPPVFNRAALDDLQLAMANEAPPWFLDWSALAALEADTVAPLGNLFAQWCATSVQLRFLGSESLERGLRDCTSSGDKSSDQAPWRLRMDALRVMRMQDEFELVALDYCVTYEVSPPPWQEARCGFVRESAGGAGPQASMAEVSVPEDPDFHDSDANPQFTVPMGFESSPAMVVELSGEVLGEAAEALAKLEQARQGSSRMVVSCANLIRVDFSAAGSILNWVATRQAEGCHLQFRDVHRLVAAFFNVIGINEHARVVVRRN